MCHGTTGDSPLQYILCVNISENTGQARFSLSNDNTFSPLCVCVCLQDFMLVNQYKVVGIIGSVSFTYGENGRHTHKGDIEGSGKGGKNRICG